MSDSWVMTEVRGNLFMGKGTCRKRRHNTQTHCHKSEWKETSNHLNQVVVKSNKKWKNRWALKFERWVSTHRERERERELWRDKQQKKERTKGWYQWWKSWDKGFWKRVVGDLVLLHHPHGDLSFHHHHHHHMVVTTTRTLLFKFKSSSTFFPPQQLFLQESFVPTSGKFSPTNTPPLTEWTVLPPGSDGAAAAATAAGTMFLRFTNNWLSLRIPLLIRFNLRLGLYLFLCSFVLISLESSGSTIK